MSSDIPMVWPVLTMSINKWERILDFAYLSQTKAYYQLNFVNLIFSQMKCNKITI